MLSDRENYLRNVKFNYPEWIPSKIIISDASWDLFRYDMEEVVLRHPTIFPGFKKGWRDYDNYKFAECYIRNKPFKDAWGNIWQSSTNGIEGVVTNAPLSDWENLSSYRFPDPDVEDDRGPRNWEAVKENIVRARTKGDLTIGWLPHGFLFMRIQYLRGFENAMVDFAMDEPELHMLIDKLVEHNSRIIDRYLDIGVDMIELGEDLGSQNSLFISPETFRKTIMPAYIKMIKPCKDKSVVVALHSDGRILDILEDQIAAGVDIVNPQDLCNGIDNLARVVKGKACIRLDIDRQTIVPYGSRKEIQELIEEEVKKLGDPRGGLEFIAGMYPPTTPDNVDSLCEAIEKYRTYWWDR